MEDIKSFLALVIIFIIVVVIIFFAGLIIRILYFSRLLRQFVLRIESIKILYVEIENIVFFSYISCLLYLIHLLDAPQGSTSPVSLTGSPTSSAST